MSDRKRNPNGVTNEAVHVELECGHGSANWADSPNVMRSCSACPPEVIDGVAYPPARLVKS